MATYVPTLLSSIQKAIACTPNHNPDTEAYTREVIPATRRIRQLAEELGNNQPNSEQTQEAISLLFKIFEVKQVEMSERRERLEEIFDRYELHQQFAHLLPSLETSLR